MKLLHVIFLCAVLSICHGYRILGLFPFHAKSHFVMFEQLMKGLTKRGHQVDVVSTFPLKKPYPNYTDLVALPAPRAFMNNMTYAETKYFVAGSATYAIASLAGNDVCEHLANPKIQELVRNPPNDPPYDLVIVEIFGAHCFAGIGHVLKVPVIGVSSSVLYPWGHGMIADPDNLAFVPNNLLSLPQRMNFFQRVHNFIHSTFDKIYFDHLTSEQTEIMRKYISPDVPSIRELENNISIILVNSHVSLNGIRPMSPALIEVGGLHVQEEGVHLSPSLEKWMNESTKGFVYFSFGSMVKIESFPDNYLKIFYNSLGKISPVRVLMKIPDPSALPPGLPNNIHILPWIPQIKVLKHPNVKAFLTHGGLMGTQEAIHYGVPMIGLPLFGDQFINIATYVRNNIAVGLDLDTLTEEKLDEALNAILYDPKYRETTQKISKKFLDRPLNAMETATFWVEYVIRNGADALRSPAIDLTWWQVQLFDVYAFLLVVTILSIYLLIFVPRYLYDLLYSSYSVSVKKKVS